MARLAATLRAVRPLFAMLALACRASGPVSLPDAARTTGVALTAIPASPEQLVIRPNSSGRIRFEVRDEDSQQPIPDYPVAFAIVAESGDTAGARLGTAHSLTDANGATVVEIMVGALASTDRPATFRVQATCPGAPPASAEVMVTTNTYYVEILPVPANDLLGATTIAKTFLYFFDNSACSDIDLRHVDSSADQARFQPSESDGNVPVVFAGVAPSGVHAVVGLGQDGAGVVRIGGCVDVPGTALPDDVTIRALLFMDHLFPALSGTYRVSSDFQLDSTQSAVKTIRTVWQQWARCPLDPARLWLDCTIAAMGPTSTGKRCVPVAGAVGDLGDRLLARRGTVVAPLAGTLAGAADTPCHADTDGDGNPSLDYAVDALFTSRRGQLQAANLGALPDEIAALSRGVHIDSQMKISQAADPNSYWIEHQLLALTFPYAVPVVAFDARTLGLPTTTASGILATFRADEIRLPSPHGFTLRLGTISRYAFEASSLRGRNVKDTAGLVKAIVALAQGNDPADPLTGCDALDAVICDSEAQPRGCAIEACRLGLDALAEELAGAFASLDGDGLDFWLAGSAPVIDLDADGLADRLGMASDAGGVAPGPGLWSAQVAARSGNYAVYGYWTAARPTLAP
jgi:hypothetical protein